MEKQSSDTPGAIDEAAPLATGWRALAALVAWILLLAAFLAQLEIQIEGPDGWAASLPTWRITGTPALQWLMGGRDITGYHTFLFSFMALVFHLPLVMHGRFSWRLESRILGSLMLFWIVEDFLWFLLNPAYGLARLTPRDVPWHPHWWLGMPADYVVFLLLGGLLLAGSYRPPQNGTEMEGGV